MFATYDTPKQFERERGPPFNSREVAEFAKTEGFHHHRVTPKNAHASA